MCGVRRCKSENAGDLFSFNLKGNCHSKELPWFIPPQRDWDLVNQDLRVEQGSAGMSPIVASMRVHQLQIPQDGVVSQPASHEAVLCLGELSEEQKVELEHSQRQLKHREQEVNQLREKLSEMSSLVEEKDQALKAAAEELRYTLT